MKMRKLIATEFLTLDGVMEAPGHEEHRDGKGGWSIELLDEEAGKYKDEELFAVDALLLGRKTYEIFAAFWPSAAGDGGFGDRMNDLPKFVVSSTLRDPEWNNSNVVNGDVAGEVARLKEQPGGDILIAGSADLVNTLMEHELIDEYRLLVHPVVLRSGKRLFKEGRDVAHLRLVDSHAFGSGIVMLTYVPARRRSPTEDDAAAKRSEVVG